MVLTNSSKSLNTEASKAKHLRRWIILDAMERRARRRKDCKRRFLAARRRRSAEDAAVQKNFFFSSNDVEMRVPSTFKEVAEAIMIELEDEELKDLEGCEEVSSLSSSSISINPLLREVLRGFIFQRKG
jgi:hypothetical protein